MIVSITSGMSVFGRQRTCGLQGNQGFQAEKASRPARPARRTSGRACKSLKTLTSGRPARPPLKGTLTLPDVPPAGHVLAATEMMKLNARMPRI
jgi:hypothetical protein